MSIPATKFTRNAYRVRPLDGINGHIEFGSTAAEPLADEQHRRFIEFTLADHDAG